MDIDEYIVGKDPNHLIVSEKKLGSRLEGQLWAESGNGSYILDELVQNGEVDLNTTYWTAGNSAVLASVANGKVGNCLSITENGANYPYASQMIACDPEAEYEIDLYAKAGTEGQYEILISDPDDIFSLTYGSGTLTAPNFDWGNRIREKFTTKPDQIRMQIVIVSHSQNGEGFTIYFDRISIQPARRVPLFGGEVVGFSIDGDGAEREVFSLSAVDAGASGEHLWFFEEDERLRLYGHPADGDSPGRFFSGPEYKYCIEASWWTGFCNRKRSNKDPLVLQRYDELLLNWKLDLWDSATDLRHFIEHIAGGTSAITRDTDTFDADSAYAAKITIDAGGNDAYYQQNIHTKPNRKHSIFVRYKTGATGGLRLIIRDSGYNVYLNSSGEWATGFTVINPPASETYTMFELEFDTHAVYSEYQLIVHHTTASTTSWVDRLSLRRHRKPMQYLQFLDRTSIPHIYQGVGDYYQGDIRLEFGTVKYLNDGWWYDRKGIWLFHNRENLIKIGDADSEWEDLEQIFTGVTRNPKWKDEKFTNNVKDSRISDLTKIPRTRFNDVDYPDINASNANKIIPVLLGYKTNITPIWEDQEAGAAPFTFKVSETDFNNVNYAMEDIVNVYKDGVTLVGGGVDYTEDLTNGRFTLTIDPENALITCDAKGLKIDFEDGTYSDNVADFIHFILAVLNNVNEERLNIASLLDLKASRTQTLGLYLKEEKDTMEAIKQLVQSCTFHVFPVLDGSYITKYYDPTVPSDVDLWNTEDMDDFELLETTDQAFRDVVIQYNQDPSTGNWLEVHDENLCTEAIHKVKNVLILKTALTSAVEAATLRDFYLDLIANPADKIKATLSLKSLLYYPTIQAAFSRQYVEEKRNTEIQILEDEVYRLLEITKDAHLARADVVGIKNVQVSGVTRHSDSPHIDHTDSVHTDVAHSDQGHVDSHTDNAYVDGYADNPYDDHTDEFHLDVAYIDVHTDEPHEDSHTDYHEDEYTDTHTDHEDGPYTDEHTDDYNDFYQDVPHDDHSDTAHYDIPYQDHQDDQPHDDDPHDDEHIDTAYGDSHSDAAHGDSAHVDSHTDLHDDTPHSDSYL